MGEHLHGNQTQTVVGQKELVSIIAPAYNEEASIEAFVARLASSIAPLANRYDFEFILVDDGSRDATLQILKKLAHSEARLRVVELRRNYGQTPALQAGFDVAEGQIFVTMDSDLQHFPEEIPLFLQKLSEGYDMVCGWRHERQEGVVRRWPSRAANALIRKISGIQIHDFGTTFRAYRAELAHDIDLFGEFHRFIPVLGKIAGAKITELPIKNIERPGGKSNYGLGRTVGVFFDLLVLHFLINYMDRPIRAFGKVAAILAIAATAIYSALLGIAFAYNIPSVREHSGWFMMATLFMIAAIQIALSGILAELLIRIHYSIGDRKVYKVRRIWDKRSSKS